MVDLWLRINRWAYMGRSIGSGWLVGMGIKATLEEGDGGGKGVGDRGPDSKTGPIRTDRKFM